MSFLDMSRERAEALVKDLVKAGEVQKGKAQKAIDDLLERSRKGGEEFRNLIQREINQQLTAMGLATQEDVARIEARLAEMEGAGAGPGAAGAAGSPPPPAAEPAKAAPVKRAKPSKAAPATAKGAAQAPPMKKAGPPRKKAAPPAPPAGEE